jgi:outer membrane protein OmpA-like peptidoglycan-associated protein
MIKVIHLFTLLLIASINVDAQSDTINLTNPSFEDIPKRGGEDIRGISGWFDCGKINFPLETPPDIHPNGYWENNLPASDGATYLGMVVRDNGTYESVSQRLDTVLSAGKCFSFTINLSKAERYMSPTRLDNSRLANYNTPVVLRIWGGTGFCNERELLGESNPVSNTSWQINSFEFRPKSNIRYITIEAYYKTPILVPYNGNILVDGASEIVRIPCPGEGPIYAKSKLPPHKRKKETKTYSDSSPSNSGLSSAPAKKFKPSIMKELGKTNLKEGQTIEIKNLFFKADTSSINYSSYSVLDEVFDFLSSNPRVMIEIGGHTNNTPDDIYCDRLSTARAKAVAEYLVKRGIDPIKVQFKGYGKKQPIADNRTTYGRQKNQRVEIKILSLNS